MKMYNSFILLENDGQNFLNNIEKQLGITKILENL